MYDFFCNNYYKYKLFHDRVHSNSMFIYELVNKVLEKINIYQKELYINRYFSEGFDSPMQYFWYNFMKCSFNNNELYYTRQSVNIEKWFYLYIIHIVRKKQYNKSKFKYNLYRLINKNKIIKYKNTTN
jgi:hypothetical protein